MIDAYDVLNVSFDADEEDIKKAFKKACLQHHPDKQQTNGQKQDDANSKFNEIKIARDVLVDPDRRKIHDTFNVDLGEEKPHEEIWTMGMTAMLGPLAFFCGKTFLVRIVSWILSWTYIGYLAILLCIGVAVLYKIDFSFRDISIRSEEGQPILLITGVVFFLTVLHWMSQALVDTVCFLFLVTQVVEFPMLIQDKKIGGGVLVGCLFFGWLLQNWWLWILGLQVLLLLTVFVAVITASQLVNMWMETVRLQHGDKLKEWRKQMRRERQKLQDEIADLRRRLHA